MEEIEPVLIEETAFEYQQIIVLMAPLPFLAYQSYITPKRQSVSMKIFHPSKRFSSRLDGKAAGNSCSEF